MKNFNYLQWISKMLGAYEFFPSSDFMTLIGSAMCNDSSIFQDLCKNILFLIVGFDSVQLNEVSFYLVKVKNFPCHRFIIMGNLVFIININIFVYNIQFCSVDDDSCHVE